MRVKGKLKLVLGGRTTPFSDGYRPIFNISGLNTSGKIKLTDRVLLYPNETAIVEVDFLDLNIMNLQVGDLISFSEQGSKILGTLEIQEVVHIID